MAGRKPKPTILKLIRGTAQKCRMNPNEAKLKASLPPCPDYLEGEARAAWTRIGERLLEAGLVTELDETALVLVCRTWSDYLDASRSAARTGMLVKTPSGYPMINPLLSAANASLKRLQSLLADFGMTPSSRSRITALEPQTDDAAHWKEFMK